MASASGPISMVTEKEGFRYIPLSALSFDKSGKTLEVSDQYKIDDPHAMSWLNYLAKTGFITPIRPPP
jgi:hypothetical protein